jgi:hypothetical protein
MQVNEVYKHIDGRDVVIKLLRRLFDEQGNMYCKVLWINVVNPYNVIYLGTDNVIIKKEEIGNWKPWKS